MALAIRVLQEDKSLMYISDASSSLIITLQPHRRASQKALVISWGLLGVKTSNRGVRRGTAFLSMLFLRKKKKLDPNNIPVFKISFENCFFIEKRTPFTNRWEKFLAFKHVPITCSFKAKAFARHLCCAVWAVLWRHIAILARLAAFKMPSWLSKDAANVASHASRAQRNRT